MRALFNESDLRTLLAMAASERLRLLITPDDIIDLTVEADDDGDVTVIVIEFEAPEPKDT